MKKTKDAGSWRSRLGPPSRVLVSESLNDTWDTAADVGITVCRAPRLAPNARVFVIGTCFAGRLRASLTASGREVLPAYNTGAVWFRPHHFNSVSIRREIIGASRAKAPRSEDMVDLEKLCERSPRHTRKWQDPHRRGFYGETIDECLKRSRIASGQVRQGYIDAEAFVVTLGVNEAWMGDDGTIYNQRPGEPKNYAIRGCRPVALSYEQNLDALRAICRETEGRPLYLTVSPVAMAKTYSGRDVVVANTASKAILRGAVEAVLTEFDHVEYWASYEIALALDAGRSDGRHLPNDVPVQIVETFLECAEEASPCAS